jgi:hypothetical protein
MLEAGDRQPGKEMHKIGVATMQGFIEGMTSMRPKVPVLSVVGGRAARPVGSAGQGGPAGNELLLDLGLGTLSGSGEEV